MLHLRSGRVKDALPAVDLHADVQLEVNVSFSRWATEATACRCAWPAFTEQLTHSRKPRGLLMGCLAKEKMCSLHLLIILKNALPLLAKLDVLKKKLFKVIKQTRGREPKAGRCSLTTTSVRRDEEFSLTILKPDRLYLSLSFSQYNNAFIGQ